jgi:hypothetical protein
MLSLWGAKKSSQKSIRRSAESFNRCFTKNADFFSIACRNFHHETQGTRAMHCGIVQPIDSTVFPPNGAHEIHLPFVPTVRFIPAHGETVGSASLLNPLRPNGQLHHGGDLQSLRKVSPTPSTPPIDASRWDAEIHLGDFTHDCTLGLCNENVLDSRRKTEREFDRGLESFRSEFK